MSDELKPCPFCGSINVELVFSEPVHGAVGKTVKCDDCWAVGPDSDIKIVAIQSWNRRVG
jgi:Lar family restriction alleviation protein